MNKIIAIAGPSGSGKTTNVNRILNDFNIIMPTHTTTREKRQDDAQNMYRYISVEKFKNNVGQNKFLISSFDGVRGYGILKSDSEECFEKNENILINISYKDIKKFKELNYETHLFIITFQDIESTIRFRITKQERGQSDEEEIEYRIKSAKEDNDKYIKEITKSADLIIYTDVLNKEDAYDKIKNYISNQIFIKARGK